MSVNSTAETSVSLPARSTSTVAPTAYYLFQNSETTGPFSPKAITQLMNSGTVDYTTFCCTEGQTNWKTVADFPELSD